MSPDSITGNHIFIVEDDTVMQYVMKRVFSGICRVTIFNDGQSAWEALQSGMFPDLIITDLNTPFVSGRELLVRVRASAAFCQIPVMIVSADDSPDMQFNCLLAGARDYIVKPFDPKNLISRANHVIHATSHQLSLLHA